jgi:DNA-binding Lrp family transcriptional regulator
MVSIIKSSLQIGGAFLETKMKSPFTIVLSEQQCRLILGFGSGPFHTAVTPFIRRAGSHLWLRKTTKEEAVLSIVDFRSELTYPPLMRLGDKDAKVLVCMRLAADAPIPLVAKTLGMKESSVRAITKRLKDLKVVSPLKLVNVSKLGYTEYDVTCGLALRGAEERRRFFQHLIQSKQISQVVEAGGAYHCTFTVCAQTPAAVDLFLAQLSEKFGAVFVNESIGVCLRYSIYPPKYLSSKQALKDAVVVTTEAIDPSLDMLDRKLLTAVSRHPEYSDRELARSLGMPISTVSYRLKALIEKGVLLGCINMVQPHLFQHQMFRIYLSVRGLTPKLKNQITNFAAHHPHITYLIEWLGDWQFGFGVMVEHSSQASEVVNQFYDLLGEWLNELTLFPVGEDLKMEFFPFD